MTIRRRRWWWVAAAMGLGIAAGCVATEVSLRLFPTLLPSPVQPVAAQMRWVSARSGVFRFFAAYRRLWEPDGWLRERIRPGLDVVLRGAPEYPEWPLRTDDLGLGPAGFRDTLPEGEPFAVVLGDSFGFGVGVRQEEVWSERLERWTGLPFVNLSQVGASSLHEERIYERYGSRIPARLVVWLFFQNDLKENLRFARWADPRSGLPEAAVGPAHPCLTPFHRLLDRTSLTYQLVQYWRRDCGYSALVPTPRVRVGDVELELCRDHDVCDPGVQSTMLAHGWPLARDALLATRDRAAARGAELVVVIVPSKEQVYRELYLAAVGLPPGHDVDRLVAPLRTLCAEEGLACVDLVEPFRQATANGRRLYFAVDIHWTATGHELAAEVVRAQLEGRGLLFGGLR